MRPPVLPSGNQPAVPRGTTIHGARFNEAAGFTQRKPAARPHRHRANNRFNEAAGFTQRKPCMVGSTIAIHAALQ